MDAIDIINSVTKWWVSQLIFINIILAPFQYNNQPNHDAAVCVTHILFNYHHDNAS